MNREPVLIILAGLAALVSAALTVTNALGWTHLSVGETASIIAFVTMLCGLLAAAIRGQVYSPATYTAGVDRARAELPPTYLLGSSTKKVLPATLEAEDAPYDQESGGVNTP